MMKKLFIIASLVGLFAFAFSTQTVNAWDPFKDISCNLQDESQSAVCNGTTREDPISGADGDGTLIKITRVVALFAGSAAVIIMLVSGINFITAGGDAAKAKSARDTLLNAFIGIIIIVSAQALIEFVIRRL